MKLRSFLPIVPIVFSLFSWAMDSAAAVPSLRFVSPSNGQTVATLAGVAVYAQAQAGRNIQRVEFTVYNRYHGKWWDGTRYIGQTTNLTAASSGTNWIIQSKDLVPLCCGQVMDVTAKATDSAGEFNTATVGVNVDQDPPVITFDPLQQDQIVPDLSALGGTVTDSLGAVASIRFSIRELSLDYGTGRYWNGSRFQTDPATLSGWIQGTRWMPAAGVQLPALNSGLRYEITAFATDSVSNSASASLMLQARMTQLAWDPGQTHDGTVRLQNPNTNGGSYLFKVVAQSSLAGAWRSALNVTAGEADLYMRRWDPPSLYSYDRGSTRTGSDGFVIPSEDYQDGDEWFLLVHATAGARWTLVSGEVFVHDLGTIASDARSSTNIVIGAEGMALFKTVAPAEMLAWRLWLRGATNELLVRKSQAASPQYTDLVQQGQMLVVPPYLTENPGTTLFVSVPGIPGTRIDVDSRQHRILDLAFNSSVQVAAAAADFPYVTYRVQVPVEQIAWQLNLAPSGGTPNIAVRRDRVPNEWRNDAFSETPANVGASVTLVPPPPNSGWDTPGLTDGTFFVTVYSTGPFAGTFQNITPVITDVHYEFAVTNDAPNRSGWRYYRVVNASEQLGSLGWDLLLRNYAPGTRIALRRNAVPGAWTRRNDDRYHDPISEGNMDYVGNNGFLQRPGHQADVWYIGVYTPDAALGRFVLQGQQLIGLPVAFDGSGNSVPVADEPAGRWKFFRVDVPQNALGWDARLVSITQGAPRFVVSRDVLPTMLGSSPCGYSWCWFESSNKWPTGNQWESGPDWSGCSGSAMLVMGTGSPLEPGTYYVGVQSPDSPASYTFLSRGIGLSNYAIRVRDLDFAAGVTNGTLPAGEMAIYRVNIPTNTPSWKLQLSLAEGEALLKVQKDSVPGSYKGYQNYGALFAHRQGQLMDKLGGEEWLLMPDPEKNCIEPGIYYVLVAAQNGAPYVECPPQGLANFELRSQVAPVTTLAGSLAYGRDLTFTTSQRGGETRLFQFAAPDGVASIEVSLENAEGSPIMFLNQGPVLVGTSVQGYTPGNYGTYGGTNAAWWSSLNGLPLLTAANPQGIFNLTIHASGENPSVLPDASYTLRVRAVPPTSIAFDGGSETVTAQQAGQWRFFQVDVPDDALGWELRLLNVTQGTPQFVVTRGQLPTSMMTQPCRWSSCWFDQGTNWNIGDQWMAGPAWGGCGDSMLSMAMGNPLQPGTYFIGVRSETEDCGYTLQSRGIGVSSYTYRVRDLTLSGGRLSGAVSSLEPMYFRVQVSSGTPNWKLRLAMNSGEALLKVHHNWIPRSTPATYDNYPAVLDGLGGHLMNKSGGEEWLLMPPVETGEIPPGTYYGVVVGQGDSVGNECGKTGDASFELSSRVESVIRLSGTLGYGNDLVYDATQRAGEIKLYKFETPEGIANIEVMLENRVGQPVMYFNRGPNLVSTTPAYHSSDPYGNYGGTNFLHRAEQTMTIVNPVGICSLSIVASPLNYEHPDAAYRLRVRAVPPALVAFDGGNAEVTDHLPDQWRFFQIDVPEDALGWDLRLTNIVGGYPQFVISRGELPSGLYSTPCYWSDCWYDRSTNWPAGYQWSSGSAWDSCGGPMLAITMGSPLEPGTYFIGIQNSSTPSSYTLASRGVGFTNYSIRVQDLSFTDTTGRVRLPAYEPAYYRVQVPANAPNWKLRLALSSGEALLKVQKDFLPRSTVHSYNYGALLEGRGGQRMVQSGAEEWLLLPDHKSIQPIGGTYYVAVISQGQNAEPYCGGTGHTEFELTSGTEPVMIFPQPVALGHELVLTNTQRSGEMKLYRFSVAAVSALEVRLENRVGNPVLFLGRATNLVGTSTLTYNNFDYGHYGGEAYGWQDPSIINIPNPEPGIYNLSILSSDVSGTAPDAGYVLRIRVPGLPEIAFSPETSGGGVTNRASGMLGDGQRSFFQVQVPDVVAGAPVLGWKLDLTVLSGSPSVRVCKDLLPDSGCGTSSYASESTIIAPPFLSPGRWFVEVKSSGSSEYLLASSAITTNTLARKMWVMPALGAATVAPGLTMPVFGDTGVAPNGNPLPDDQGVDLEQGQYHLYAVWVPTNNAGLLRTELRAISGNPNLFIRTNLAPTFNHNPEGSCGYTDLVDRRLVGGTTEYGNWVPLDGKTETALQPGLWVISVQASGNANARYRLRFSCGNPTPGGLVQDLALNGGSYANQHLSGGDWRYFRVVVPSNAPANWTITWSRSLGSARMFVRDTLPPGEGIRVADYSDPSYNPGHYFHPDLQTWNTDAKNQGPYPRFDTPGPVQLTIPPVRPGTVYYLGFWSPSDTTFSLSSSASGSMFDPGTEIAFHNGEVSRSIPAHGVARYFINVPADANRLKFSCTHSERVLWLIEQGTFPHPGDDAHFRSYGQDTGLDEVLGTEYPWLPGARYHLLVTNKSDVAESFALKMAVPADLAPIAFLVQTNITSVQPNPVITLIFGVTNRSSVAAVGPWHDRVWFSTNGVFDADSQPLQSFHMWEASMPPYGSYWQTSSIALPLEASGSFSLFLQVDGFNTAYEFNEQNNTGLILRGQFTLTPPDLAVASVAVLGPSSPIVPFPAYTLTWTLTNLGIGKLVNSSYDRVWLSTNGILDNDSISVGEFFRDQIILPGDTLRLTNVVTLPLQQYGPCTLFVEADTYKYITELREDNNVSAALPISVSPVLSSCVSAPAGLVGWWPGDGDAQDLFGTRHGQVAGGASFTNGAVRQGFAFDGINDTVQVPDSPSWAFGTNEFTIELWVYFNSFKSQQALVASDEGPGSVNKWILWVKNQYLALHLNGPAGATDIGDIYYWFELGRWYHVALTRQGSEFAFYVNGEMMGQLSRECVVPDAAAPLTIGSAEGAFFFDGKLDEISIYSRALQFAEIGGIFRAGSAGKCHSLPATLVFDTAPGSLEWTSGGLHMRLSGVPANTPVVIDASTNLTLWLPIHTNSSSTGSIEFLDPGSQGRLKRFYRARENR